MSGNTENVSENKINSATLDDSWVICESSSHPGLKFYVNKVTGIKVWNITDSEIAFAEKAGKDGPEPKRHPTMADPQRDGRIYNRQTINNQFSNQLPNLVVNSVPVSPFNVWDNPQNQPLHMQSQQTYTLVPTAIAQAVQQLLPLANSLQNASLPISYNSQQYVQNQQTPVRMSKIAKYRKNKWIRERYGLNHTTQNNYAHAHNTYNSDLRKKLVRRKSCSETFIGNVQNDYEEKRSSTWSDKNNWNEPGWDTSIQMDLKPLKSLTSSGSGSDQWYIVVDTEVILNNYNYLNNMTAADPDFHLLIPHHVMSELRVHVSESNNVQDRRTLRFLKDQIESGQVVMGEEVACENSAYMMMMMTCTKLASQNNHVILISNNAETFKYQLITKDIHVFTMQDIKDIVANKPNRLPRPNSPTLAVRITVPNNIGKNKVSEDYSEPPFKSNFHFTEPSEPCTERALGIQSMENYQTCIQTSPKSVVKDRPTTSAGFRSVLVHSMVNSKADCNLSSSKSAAGYEVSNSSTPNKIALVVNSVENKTVCNQSPTTPANDSAHNKSQNQNPTKSAIDGASNKSQNPSPTKSVNKSARNKSQNPNPTTSAIDSASNKSQNPSPTKSVNNSACNTNKYPRPTKPAKGSVCNKAQNRRPTKMDDDSSISSSSATSGHVSLDTIRMKKIISMKRLMCRENPQNAQKIPAKSITSPANKTSIKSTVMQAQPTNRTSVSRSASYDNDRTSDVSVTKKNIRENIIIEETSTSGVISNSESSHSEKMKSPFKDVKKVALRTGVMFRISCQSMEDVLKTRWDEWVFRFVQIMEEVLRVKLQEKLAFDNKEYPAPRDLQEAARCIIKKFSNNFNVVDAANKLSFILYKMSNEHGKIAVNIEPTDYMEMYSHGVYLVETFQDMSAECKEKDCKKEKTNRPKQDAADSCSCFEVNTASESLKKLLYDIQNANLETFVDLPRDHSSENINPESDQYDDEMDTREEMPVDGQYDQQTEIQEEMQCDDHFTHNSYNLRSQKIIPKNIEENEKLSNDAMTGKGIESTFFKSLQLQKTFHTNKPMSPTDAEDLIKNDKRNASKNIAQCHSPEQQTPDKPQNEENLHNLKIHFSKHDFTDIAKSQSKVVCNFTLNSDIERRVKAKQNEKEYENEYEYYSENHLDYEEDNFEDGIGDEAPAVDESGTYENNNESNSESNRNFKCFMGRISRVVSALFTQVQLLCNEYVEEVASVDMSRKNLLHHKIDMAYSFIGKIYHSLDSITKRDLDLEHNVQVLLKIAKCEDFIPDDQLCLEYGYMINVCKKTAGDIHNIIGNILKEVFG